MTLTDIIGLGQAHELEPVEQRIHATDDFLRLRNATDHGYFLAGDRALHALPYSFDAMCALVAGQDPYPTPGHPVELSFSVDPSVRLIPRSLVNIYREPYDDLSISPAGDGDLTSRCEQGVMLLNRVLTVRPGKPTSCRGRGWEKVTTHAIRKPTRRGGPLVAILWGRPAQELEPLLDDMSAIESPHLFPLSVTRGFLESRPFSRANISLIDPGGHPVDWSLQQTNWLLRQAN